MLSSDNRLLVIRMLTYGSESDDVEALHLLKEYVTPKGEDLPPLNYAETELRKAGRTIQAIRAYRERIQQTKGFIPSLLEAKNLVEIVAKNVDAT